MFAKYQIENICIKLLSSINWNVNQMKIPKNVVREHCRDNW